MPDRLWKAAERAIAKRLGGIRVPVSGRQRGDQPDIRHPLFALEVKAWKTIPRYLDDALDQATKSALPNQLPIAVFHRTGDRYDAALVVMELKTLITLQSLIERKPEATE